MDGIFNAVMERMTQLWLPGIEKFYEKFERDPWQRADDDLSEVLLMQDNHAATYALMGFEARKRKLVDLYKEFLALQEIKRRPTPATEELHREQVLLARDTVLCDACKKSVSETKSITMRFVIVQDELGDPVKKITAICESCARREKK